MKEYLIYALLAWLVFVNLWAFILCWWDKRKAKQGAWRVPEKTLMTLAPSSIFVFAAHGLFSGTLRRVLQKLFMPQSSLSLIFFYFLSLAVTVAAMTALYFVLKKMAPKILKFTCGR